MAVTPSEITANMRAVLRVIEPDLDTSAGSVVRKMLDVVSEQIAEAYLDEHLLSYQYDLDAKSGEDLDDLVGLFGIMRYTERRAVGTIIFERNVPAEEDIFIPFGTQVVTSTEPPVIAATQVPTVMRTGDTTVSVPARMVTPGAIGNIAAGAISRIVTPVMGIAGAGNTLPFIGGRDAESDATLRRRFRATVFHSLAGTNDFYLALALDDEDAINASVLGVTKNYREQIEIVSGAGTSTVPDARSIYAGMVVVGSDIDAGDILIEGFHYQFDHTQNPPVVTSLDGTAMPDGVYDLEFTYEPIASRNDVEGGITNRVDVYVHGVRPVTSIDNLVFRTSAVFTNTSTDQLFREKFEREDGTNPVAGNYFVRYGFVPVIDPSTDVVINIGGVSYAVGTNAFLVQDITNQGLSPRSLSGVELRSAANGGPAAPPNNSVFTVEYIFNEVPRSVTAAIGEASLLTTDVMVHQAKPIRLNMFFAAILLPGYSPSNVEEMLFADLERFITRSGFANVLQTSDLLGVVKQVQGVDAIRFLTSADNATNFAIQRVANDGTTLLNTYADGGGRAVDVISGDDELPVLHSVTVSPRAQNTFAQGQ